MPTSFGALCTDFYVNHTLSLKMDLPDERETVLHLFDRVRKSEPAMDRFRRYEDELSLESSRRDPEYKWLALRRTSVRTGHVNPQSLDAANTYHKLIMQLAPYHLSLSPLDIDHHEVLFGFDLECKQDHDEVVFESLLADSPLGNMAKLSSQGQSKVLDAQPSFGFSLDKSGDRQVYFEVKTRQKSRRGRSSRYSDEPISIFLTLRQYGPVNDVEQLQSVYDELAQHCEQLAGDHLIPDLLTPIARYITTGSA